MLSAAGSHPNVLKIFESAYNELWGLAHMCMEYCSGGDLCELQCYYGTQHMHVPWTIIFQAIINVSDGLAFLHGGWVGDEKTGIYEKKTANADHIVHRDLVRNAREMLSIVVSMLILLTENNEHLHKAQSQWQTPNICTGRLWAGISFFGSTISVWRRDAWFPSTGVL